MMFKNSTLGWIMIGVNSILFLYECYQLLKKGLASYVESKMNILDMGGYTCGIIWLTKVMLSGCLSTTHVVGISEEDPADECELNQYWNYAKLAWTIAVCIRFLDFLKLFPETRRNYVIITVGLNDIVGFSIIFFVMCFSFAVILQFMYFPHNQVFLWEQNALTVVYALGGFETPGV
jgi:hypothetical protein